MPQMLIKLCLSLVHISHANILSSTHTHTHTHTHTACSSPQLLTRWDLGTIFTSLHLSRLSTHLSSTPSHPSIYVWLCLSSSAQPLAFLRSQNIMTDGDGAPINVSPFLFFTSFHFFHSISVQCLWKGETVCHLLASSQWRGALKDGGWPAMLTGKCQPVCILSTLNLDSLPCLLFSLFFVPAQSLIADKGQISSTILLRRIKSFHICSQEEEEKKTMQR